MTTAAIALGQRSQDGRSLRVDLPHLIETRLLVQANSGAGKSWTLRRLLEQSFGRVQHLVIDPEGEFASLRERYDYVLAGRGGDTPAEPRSAKLLARRLLELRTSAILDVYELKAHERVRFVRYFLEALVDAPKTLWHPVLVVVDEAHIYAPQKGEAESLGAVIDLATRGRKRGFCAVLATQRIAKLHKDAAAELNNKLIGRSSLDVDMRRAAEELGFTTREDQQRLRTLRPGEFFAFGPALADTVERVTIGGVETTHPKMGTRHLVSPPPATDKVKAILGKLADLPAEAEQEARDLASLRKDNAELRRQITRIERAGGADPEQVKRRVQEATEPLRERLSGLEDAEAEREGILGRLLPLLAAIPEELDGIAARLRAATNGHTPVRHPPARRERPAPKREPTPPVPALRADPPEPLGEEDDGPLSGPQQRILDALASFEPLGIIAVQRSVVAVYSGASPASSAYTNNLGALRTRGLIDYPLSGHVCLTETGRALAEPSELVDSVGQLHAAWYTKLPRPQAAILRVLIDAYPDEMSREDVAEAAGASPNSSAYSNNLGRLRSGLGVVEYSRPGFVRASEKMLFPEGVPL